MRRYISITVKKAGLKYPPGAFSAARGGLVSMALPVPRGRHFNFIFCFLNESMADFQVVLLGNHYCGYGCMFGADILGWGAEGPGEPLCSIAVAL